MPVLKLPLADHFDSATLLRWWKKPGEAFAADEPLAELETEDATISIRSAVAGVLHKQLTAPGQTVLGGGALAEISSDLSSSAPAIPAERSMNESPSADAGEATPVLMPQAGNSMEEGTVIEWRVKPGDRVAAGQILCEIETDKATIEYESPAAGRVALLVAQVGEPVAVREMIAVLAETDAAAQALVGGGKAAPSPLAFKAHAAVVAAPVVTREASHVRTDGRVKVSPAARKLARERGIALATLGAGSGPGGRVLSTDVPQSGASHPASGEAVRRPLSKMRRAIGVNLQRSKQTIPHFYVRTTIDAGSLMAHYKAARPATNCSVNDLIVLAVGRAMRDFPAVRSQIDGDHIVEFPHANIGIAVGVDDGLVVPVVLGVDKLSLAELAKESKRVVQAGRKGMLENVGKGNFTISNLGMFGVEEFGAIINPPESGILAVSAVRETVIVKDGAMTPGRVMTLTLSADHRVVDGVLAAKFMARLKEILEHPAEELS